MVVLSNLFTDLNIVLEVIVECSAHRFFQFSHITKCVMHNEAVMYWQHWLVIRSHKLQHELLCNTAVDELKMVALALEEDICKWSVRFKHSLS